MISSERWTGTWQLSVYVVGPASSGSSSNVSSAFASFSPSVVPAISTPFAIVWTSEGTSPTSTGRCLGENLLEPDQLEATKTTVADTALASVV
jgi:hypothetical protein